MSANYSIDDSPGTIVSYVGDPFASLAQGLQQPNFLLYQSHNLNPGNHTLKIEIIACQNQTFILDYLTYIPSFESLASMPKFPPPNTAGASGPGQSSASKSHVAPIVAGIVGGVVVIALGVLFFLWRRRRERNENTSRFGESCADLTIGYRTDILSVSRLYPHSISACDG